MSMAQEANTARRRASDPGITEGFAMAGLASAPSAFAPKVDAHPRQGQTGTRLTLREVPSDPRPSPSVVGNVMAGMNGDVPPRRVVRIATAAPLPAAINSVAAPAAASLLHGGSASTRPLGHQSQAIARVEKEALRRQILHQALQNRDGGLQIAQSGRVEPSLPRSVPQIIWVCWEYPARGKQPNVMVQLNMETWQRALPGWKVILVNDSNIRDHIADLPEEYFRMPYPQAKSDVMRAGVLYHHGGLYVDTDFIVSPRIAEVRDLFFALANLPLP